MPRTMTMMADTTVSWRTPMTKMADTMVGWRTPMTMMANFSGSGFRRERREDKLTRGERDFDERGEKTRGCVFNLTQNKTSVFLTKPMLTYNY